MRKNVQIIAWIAFIAIAGGAVLYALQGGNAGQSEAGGAGQEARNVQILKYSDYSCPTCRNYIPMQEALKNEFGEQVTIEYRHFPLGSFPHSELAARAVEAAAEQGRKTEMHNRIFEEQSRWSNAGNAEEIFLSYAEEIGLDMDRFRSDLESSEIRQRIQRQKSEGERRMVRATPTFFINGQRVQQIPRDYDQFRALVEMHMYR